MVITGAPIEEIVTEGQRLSGIDSFDLFLLQNLFDQQAFQPQFPNIGELGFPTDLNLDDLLASLAEGVTQPGGPLDPDPEATQTTQPTDTNVGLLDDIFGETSTATNIGLLINQLLGGGQDPLNINVTQQPPSDTGGLQGLFDLIKDIFTGGLGGSTAAEAAAAAEGGAATATGGQVGDVSPTQTVNVAAPDFGDLASIIDAIRGPEEAPAPTPLTSLAGLLQTLIPNVFGGEPFESQLRDFAFDPQQLSVLEQQLTRDILDHTDIAGQLAGGQNLLSGLFPTISEGAQTGFPQDARDLFSQYASTIAEPLFAQAAERAPGGVASSGFLAESGNIAQRLAGEGARAQIAANEAARGRQLDFLSGAPGFVGATTALPLAGLQDVFGLGQAGRDINLGIEGQPLQTLLSLGGLSDPGAFFQSKFLPGGSSLGDLFRGLGGFGTTTQQTQGS